MATRKRTPPKKRTASARKPARKVAAKKTRGKTGARKPARVKVAAKPKTAPKKRAAPKAAKSKMPPFDLSLFPCGDDALRAATGRDWAEWIALLDASGASKQAFNHQRIWDLAMQSLPETAGWWGQMVSVGYERARGLREKHESCNGEFQATSSKTLPVPLFAAFAAWADESLRGEWLEAPDLSFTKLNAGKNIRARWPNGALLDIRFNATGPDKCQIVVDTMKLTDADAVAKAKAFWQSQFERLQAYLRI